ncbi:hypothetical protein [Jiulongibacter sp. NS-SX5]|uniref:hypothetical protein n=1 Tax=Jiulongibacter sp. NS-SX5 TaxID=3463854 RepID=UPI004059F997
MKNNLLPLVIACLLLPIYTYSQSVEILPGGLVENSDSTQVIIGTDTLLPLNVQLYNYREGADTIIWGKKNQSFEVNWSMLTSPTRDLYEFNVKDNTNPSQFEISMPNGRVSITDKGNLLLGNEASLQNTEVLLDAQSKDGGGMITASGIGISTAIRSTHYQQDLSYNEVQGLYAHADSGKFVNTSVFAESGTSALVANLGVMGRVYAPPVPTSKSIAINGIDIVDAPNTYAGEFLGKVNVIGNVSINGTLSKSSGTFKIDHPQDPYNKYLYHSFVESPDMMNIYNGNITTGIDSLALVLLPSYFESLNMDFRYQLTVIGQFAQAIIFETISGNSFTIKTDKPNVQVSWMVTGIRKDAYANDHRVVPEQVKPINEIGTRLYNPGGGSEGFAIDGKDKSSSNLTYPR